MSQSTQRAAPRALAWIRAGSWVVALSAVFSVTVTRTPAHAQVACFGALPAPTAYAIPMFDWRYSRDGELPMEIGAALVEDAIKIRVEDGGALGLLPNQMMITLMSTLNWQKQIIAWNSATGYDTAQEVSTPGTFEGSIRSPGFSGIFGQSTTITRGTCGQDTVVLAKAKTAGVLTGMYHFDLANFWTLWGGKKVTITWLADHVRGAPPSAALCSGQCVPDGWPAPAIPPARLVGDFNGDGQSDVVVFGAAGQSGLQVAFSNWRLDIITRGPAAGNFGVFSRDPGVSRLVGDFDGDGRDDLALVGSPVRNTLPVAFFRYGGYVDVTNAGIWQDYVDVAAMPGVQPMVGDFNHDKKADIALLGGAGRDFVPVAFSNGDGTFNVTTYGIGDFGMWAAAANVKRFVADFNNDGFSDLALTGGPGWRSIPIAFSNGDGTFRVVNDLMSNDFGTWASQWSTRKRLGDFDGDGLPDIALLGVSAWTTIPVAHANANGTFRVTNMSVPDFPGWSAASDASVLVGDFDNDKKSDIALTGVKGWTTIPVAFSRGNGTFMVTNASVPDFPGWSSDYGVTRLVGRFGVDNVADIVLVGGRGWNTLPIASGTGTGGFVVGNPSAPSLGRFAPQ